MTYSKLYNSKFNMKNLLLTYICLSVMSVVIDGFLPTKSIHRIQSKYVHLTATSMQSDTPSTQEDEKPRVYVPRSKPSVGSTSTTPTGSESGDGRGSSRTYTPKRSYTPREGSSYTPRNSGNRGDRSGGQRRGSGGGRAALALTSPMTLRKYAVPREKTSFKLLLESQQDDYKASRDNQFGGSSNDIFGSDDFNTFDPSGGKSGGFKGRGSKSTTERKGSEGAKPKAKEGRRGKASYTTDDDGDDYDDDGEYDDYFGEDSGVTSISDIPVSAIKNMEQEGFSWEEIQIALYGEYGIKVSVAAIRKKLREGNRKGTKRTGKTRKERQKSRNARQNPTVDAPIKLNDEVITIRELSELLDVGAGQVVGHLMMNMGIMTTITQTIERSVAAQVVEAFGKKVAGAGNNDDDDNDEDDSFDTDYFEDDGGDEETLFLDSGDIIQVERVARPPVVTIMGHVDHGKTSLLDAIRNAKVASGEAGGITQAISAFKVNTDNNNQEICFIDTPGHAAFSDMRKRGANVTDIVVLVVAADDGVMEQTKECIVAAKQANCPLVVAINKIDKEGADPRKVATELTEYDILLEEFGGNVQMAEVSAKQSIGLDDLLSKVLLQSELMNLRAPVDAPAEGSVIESKVDKGLGVVTSLLVQRGTLKIGDYVLAGPSWGRVRRLISDQGEDLQEAGPSTPVQVIGMNVVPNAGDLLTTSTNEAGVREVAEARQRIARQSTGAAIQQQIIGNAAGMTDGSIDNRDILKVPIIIKGDVVGSIEAIRTALGELTLNDDEAICMADVVFAGVGDVTSSDVAIAAASKAKIIAFNVAAGMTAMDEARSQNIDIGYYSVVYDLLDEMEATIQKTLSPPPPGELVGRANIKKVFKIGKVGRVAGCEVTEGSIRANTMVRIMRGKRNPIYQGTLSALKVIKDEVQEVPEGSECGMSFEDFQDFEADDVVECFSTSGKDFEED